MVGGQEGGRCREMARLLLTCCVLSATMTWGRNNVQMQVDGPKARSKLPNVREEDGKKDEQHRNRWMEDFASMIG